jgi:AcrR family transcriptional regulator
MPRPADRRAKIELLRAAEAAFAEHGLAAAKVEDITARAGVSKGAFYLHFESKEDCFRQIVEGFLARLAEAVEPEEAALSPASLPEMRASWVAHNLEVMEFFWQNRGLLGMILAGGGGAPFAYLIDELAERVAKQTERSVMMAQQNGLYRADIEPSVVAALISGAYDRLARELIKQPKRPPIEAWSEQVPDVFLNGLLAAGRAIPRAAGARSKARSKAPSKTAMPKIPDQRVTINARRRRTTKAANDEGSPGAASRKRGVRAQ